MPIDSDLEKQETLFVTFFIRRILVSVHGINWDSCQGLSLLSLSLGRPKLTSELRTTDAPCSK